MPKLPPKRPRSWEVQRPPQSGRTFVNPWYHTQAWRKLRAAKKREDPYCVQCRNEGMVARWTDLDHIIPVSTGKTLEEKERLMWDWDNTQGLCKYHHNSKSGKEKYATFRNTP